MVCTRHLTLALPIQWQSCGIPLVSQFFAEKNKVIWRLWVGPYSEKLWPRVWNAFSRPGSQFFTLETSLPANNVIYTFINLVFRIAGIWFQKKKKKKKLNPRYLKLLFWLRIINQRIVCNEIKIIKISLLSQDFPALCKTWIFDVSKMYISNIDGDLTCLFDLARD